MKKLLKIKVVVFPDNTFFDVLDILIAITIVALVTVAFYLSDVQSQDLNRDYQTGYSDEMVG